MSPQPKLLKLTRSKTEASGALNSLVTNLEERGSASDNDWQSGIERMLGLANEAANRRHHQEPVVDKQKKTVAELEEIVKQRIGAGDFKVTVHRNPETGWHATIYGRQPPSYMTWADHVRAGTTVPCAHEVDAKLLQGNSLKGGHRVSAKTLEGHPSVKIYRTTPSLCLAH
jgi:hypothetical protein